MDADRLVPKDQGISSHNTDQNQNIHPKRLQLLKVKLFMIMISWTITIVDSYILEISNIHLDMGSMRQTSGMQQISDKPVIPIS